MKQLITLFFVIVIIGCSQSENSVSENKTLILPESVSAVDLGRTIDSLNDKFKYDLSLLLLQKLIVKSNDSMKFVCFLYESLTYKRLFKYDDVFRCLDSAQLYGLRCSKPEYYLNKISAERAFALFDTQKYEQADTVMKLLREKGFVGLTNQQQAFIIMQEGYIDFGKHNYKAADIKYNEAIKALSGEYSKDLPVVYGKQIELYLAQKNDSAAYFVYEKANLNINSSDILKYRMYINDMMKLGFLKRGEYKNVYTYTHIVDSLYEIYNKSQHINTLAELETKYQVQQKEQALISSRNKEIADERLIAFLITVLISLMLIVMLLYLLQQRRKAIRERNLHQQFTAQLFKKTEEERQRIAVDLHDGISHELLQLKELNSSSETINQIDHVINEIRNISRNLHPAMFERVGLKLSIEQLAERIEQQHEFLISLDLDYEKLLSSATELQLYRIIQEALNNVLKHSNAHAAFISMKNLGDYTQVIIKDNGSGFSVLEKIKNSSSFGIHNMLERTEAIGGKAQIDSGTDGTIITIKIPNNKK
jgi:signal transduction histidine kinase